MSNRVAGPDHSWVSGFGSGDGTSGVRSFSRERSRSALDRRLRRGRRRLVERLAVGQATHLVGVQHLARQQRVGNVDKALLVLGEDARWRARSWW